MYVSRRIERDRGADVKAKLIASIMDRAIHCEGSVVVGYEVERWGSCVGDGVGPGTSRVD